MNPGDLIVLAITGIILICATSLLAITALFQISGLKKRTKGEFSELKLDMERRIQTATMTVTGSMSENAMQNEQKLENIRTSIQESMARIQDDSNKQLDRMWRVVEESADQNTDKLEKIRETMQTSITALQEDNSRQLDKMRETVDEKLQKTLEERIGRSFALVSQRLEEVYKGLGEMQNLASGVGDLKKVLSNVKTRGIIGEIQLGAILEQILAKEQYDENVEVKPGSRGRVEFAVKMPGDGDQTVYLPIDAKFHGDTYSKLMAAYDTGDRDLISDGRKLLLAALKTSAKDISEKYINPPITTDFAIMFLPFEGLYAEAVNLGALETIQKEHKVVISGPSTMAALLNSLQMGFKTLAIQKHSGEVWNILGAVKTEFDRFGDVLASTQRKLTQANSDLDRLIGTRTRSIQRTLRQVQSLPSDFASSLIESEEEPVSPLSATHSLSRMEQDEDSFFDGEDLL